MHASHQHRHSLHQTQTEATISTNPKELAELLDARSRLESTLAAAEIGTWEYDVVRNVVYGDRNLAIIFGVTPEVANGGPLEAYVANIHPDDRERVGVAICNSLKDQDRFEAEYRIIGGDTNTRWVIARGRVERDATGKPIKLPGVIVDVTAQRQVETQLQESEKHRRLALDSGQLGAWNINPATNQLSSDSRFRQIFHGSDDPITYEQAFATVHPDDRIRIRDAIAAATRPDDPAPYSEEYRVVRTDGTIHWVLAIGRANFEESASARVLSSFDGTITDITDRKLAEEKIIQLANEADRQRRIYNTVLSNTPDFNYTFDLQGRFTYINKALLDLWQKSFEEAVGKTFFELDYPPDLANKLHRQIQQVIETQQPVRDETPYTSSFGESQYEYIFVPVMNAEGEVEAVAGSTRDITEQKRIQTELREIASRLSEADRRKNEFLATLAHELRNPLAPIRSGLEVMKYAMHDPVVLDQVRTTMERQAKQMVRLIDDLLEVSRITQGKMELRKCRVALSDVVQSAVEASQPYIEEGEHELTLSMPAKPILLHVDPNRLAQVISNMLNNSAKYTPTGGKIELSAKLIDPEVLISIKDNGIGIPSEMLTSIFDMFTQVDRSLETGYKGLGIGLTLVKRLVEMHEGSISVSSEGENKGSEFVVRLPVLKETTADITQSMMPGTSISQRHRILVVDDNSDSANMLSLIVKMLGNEVQVASDGLQAVKLAEEFLPQVILMDIGMPHMNGYEAAKLIRQKPWGKEMMLVALTGWGQDEDRLRSKEAGFDHHLVKPAEPVELQRILAKVESTNG